MKNVIFRYINYKNCFLESQTKKNYSKFTKNISSAILRSLLAISLVSIGTVCCLFPKNMFLLALLKLPFSPSLRSPTSPRWAPSAGSTSPPRDRPTPSPSSPGEASIGDNDLDTWSQDDRAGRAEWVEQEEGGGATHHGQVRLHQLLLPSGTLREAIEQKIFAFLWYSSKGGGSWPIQKF